MSSTYFWDPNEASSSSLSLDLLVRDLVVLKAGINNETRNTPRTLVWTDMIRNHRKVFPLPSDDIEHKNNIGRNFHFQFRERFSKLVQKIRK